MLNFHGGTVISSLTLALNNVFFVFFFYDVGHIAVVLTLFFVSFSSLALLMATLIRFFINLSKCEAVFSKPERRPY